MSFERFNQRARPGNSRSYSSASFSTNRKILTLNSLAVELIPTDRRDSCDMLFDRETRTVALDFTGTFQKASISKGLIVLRVKAFCDHFGIAPGVDMKGLLVERDNATGYLEFQLPREGEARERMGR